MTLKLSEQCIRGEVYTHAAPAVPGHSFCGDCLAWLRCESDNDPIGDRRPKWEPPETTPEMWLPYADVVALRNID